MNDSGTAIDSQLAGMDRLQGPALLEFGTLWCGHCLRAQPLVSEAMCRHPGLQHIKVEDGPGRRLGRSFAVKLWPTLIALHDGVEVGRVVRPQDVAEIENLLRLIDPPACA